MPRKRFPYYPIFLDVEERDVLVVGGGKVASRKVETLLQYGANVTVLSPALTDELEQLGVERRIRIERREYTEHDLDARALVIAATADICTNARVARDCRRRGISVNVVDATHLSEFIVPATIDRGSVQIAVSTGGNSPALARRLRETLEERIGPEYSELNDLLGSLRHAAKRALPTDADRKQFFERVIDGADGDGVLTMLRDGRRSAAFESIAAACRDAGVPLPEVVRDGLRNGSPE
jgi:siroheme synthase-like protein